MTNVSTHVSGGKEEKTLLTRAVAGPSKPLQEEKTLNLNAIKAFVIEVICNQSLHLETLVSSVSA